MTLSNDYYPLITGPWARALSIWIEIIVFALSLLSGYGIVAYITFSLTFLTLIFDITLFIKRHKAQKHQASQPPPYIQSPSTSTSTFQPRKRVIVFDFIFGTIYLLAFIFMLLFGGSAYGGYRYDHRGYGYGGYYSYYSSALFPAFTMIGVLALAHVHIFFGSFETDVLRKMKKSKKNTATAPMPQEMERDIELEAGNSRKL